MINSIASQLNGMGIPCIVGGGADITVETEFLDAKWGTGQKKIEYHASAFLNDSERVLYFWEFTKETGSGFSFGGSSESSFQSGTTLFRKVKSIQYGLDGQAYEYSLDLGAITKTFKTTAKQAGWKFKVVLKRDKASYPPGYIPFTNTPSNYQPPAPSFPSTGPVIGGVPPIIEQPQPTISTQQRNDPSGQFYVQQNTGVEQKIGAGFWAPFITLLLISVIFFIGGEASLIGWIILAAIFILLFVSRSNFSGKGFLINAAIWVVVLIVLIITFGLA